MIVDATFSRRADRDALAAVATSAGAEIIWIFAEVNDEVRLQRLRDRERRSDVISDAREEDLQTLAARFEAPVELSSAELIRVDTGTAIESSQSAWLAEMARRQATSVAT